MSYATHIGRVGALAVALGVGIAVATTPGVASAQTDTETVSADDATATTATDTPADPPADAPSDTEAPADEDLNDEDLTDEDTQPDADNEDGSELDDAVDGTKGSDKTPSSTDDDSLIRTLSGADADADDDADAAFRADVLQASASNSANAAAEEPEREMKFPLLATVTEKLLVALTDSNGTVDVPPAQVPGATINAVGSVVSDVFSSLLEWGTGGTGSPLDNTLLFSLLAFARRELEPLTNLNPFAAAAPAAALALGPNLLANGGFEVATPTLTGNAATTVPGWTPDGTPSVIPYGQPRQLPSPLEIEFPNLPAYFNQPDAPAGAGNNFVGGGAQATTAISQTVKLDTSQALKDEIDTGTVSYDLSALLGGWTYQRSEASVTVNFLDANGNSLGTGQIAPVSVFDRKFQTQMLDRNVTGVVPVGTRSAEVTVDLTEKNFALPHYNNAKADNISFSISSDKAVANTLEVPDPWKGAGKVDHVFVVFMENKGYSEVLGPIGQIDPRIDFPFNVVLPLLGPFGKLPYVYFGIPILNLTANSHVSASKYHGLMHPSNINYVATLAASDLGLNSNCFHQCTDAPSLVDNVNAAGLTWAGYAQGDESPYAVGVTGGLPFNAFNNIYNNPVEASKVHGLEQLQLDLQLRGGSFASTPNFVWIAADDAQNGEGPTKGERGYFGGSGAGMGSPLDTQFSLSPETALWAFNKIISWTFSQLGLPGLNGGIGKTTALGLGIAQYNNQGSNNFLEQNLQTIYHSDVWNDPNESCVIFITYDEDNDNLSIGDGNEGNHIYFSAVGNPKAIADGFQTGGAVDDVNYNHYSLTRTINDALGLPYLTNNDKYAEPMNGLWN